MAKHNRDDIDKFHDYSIHVPTRTLFMGNEDNDQEHGESGTDGAMAERVIKNLHLLEAMNKDPVVILMDNIGGDVNHGLAIYDAIRGCESHVIIKAFGSAMSMGSIILQAADERIMSANATQMIHYGHITVEGHAKTVEKIVKDNARLDEWMERMYLEKIKIKHPDFTLAKVKKLLDHDTFLAARDSINLGLADKILGEDDV
jgi:ATP-dependent Clp protease, protease subunit